MNKKYELVNQREDGLYQIKALRDFGNVRKGKLGGWIQSEYNLSHDGLCWTHLGTKVYGNARVFGNAEVYGNARVFGEAKVFGDSEVSGNARVYGNAWVFGEAKVFADAKVFGDSEVSGNAWVSGEAEVYGNAKMSGEAEVYGSAVCTKSVLNFILSKHSMTVTDNLVAIGCEQHSLEHWLANYKEIGFNHSYNKQEIKLYGKLLKALKYIQRG